MKSNYGPNGGEIRLTWGSGVLFRLEALGQGFGRYTRGQREAARRSAQVGQARYGRRGRSQCPQQPAKMVRKLPGYEKLSFGVILASQERLLDQNKIVRVVTGPPSKRRVYLRPADRPYLFEPPP